MSQELRPDQTEPLNNGLTLGSGSTSQSVYVGPELMEVIPQERTVCARHSARFHPLKVRKRAQF